MTMKYILQNILENYKKTGGLCFKFLMCIIKLLQSNVWGLKYEIMFKREFCKNYLWLNI